MKQTVGAMEEVQNHAQHDSRFDVLASSEYKLPTKPRRTRPVLSKFERCRVLAARTEQIGRGTNAFVDRLDGESPAETAEREFAANRTPFIIRRYLGKASRFFFFRCLPTLCFS